MMNSQNENNAEALVERALRDWKIKEPLPPRFHDQVWRRIERTEAEAAEGFWVQLTRWVNRTFAKPSLAVSYITLLLLAGLLAGYWQARVEKTRTVESLSSRYVQMIDPYQARH